MIQLQKQFRVIEELLSAKINILELFILHGHLLKEKRRMSPVILLDEIFAELDEHRTQGLIELFGDFSQLFLTTANEAPVTLRDSGCCYRVVEGRVEVIA